MNKGIVSLVFLVSLGTQASYIQKLHQEQSDYVYYIPSGQQFINPLVSVEQDEKKGASIEVVITKPNKKAEPKESEDLFIFVKDAYNNLINLFE